MRKYILYVTAIVITLIMLTYASYNIYHNNKNIDFRSYYNNVKNLNPDMEYKYIQEISDETDKTLEKLYNGHYENLSGKNVIVSLSDEDYVTEMKEYDGGVYHGITDPRKMYEEQMRVIHYFLGEDLNIKYLIDGNCLLNDGKDIWNLYLPFDEVVKHIKNNTYGEIASINNLPDITYAATSDYLNTDNDSDKRYCHMGDRFINVNVIKGKYIELADTSCEDPKYELDSMATYYPTGQNLEDIYELNNGAISIGNAIDFVEYYWAE